MFHCLLLYSLVGEIRLHKKIVMNRKTCLLKELKTQSIGTDQEGKEGVKE